jgi:2-iminobutanoate/2-iminopropanoate deaminase
LKEEIMTKIDYVSDTGVFSQAVKVGNFLFVAGQVGVNDAGKIIAGGLDAQARQAFKN